MLPDVLHDRAALYVSGALEAPERECFEGLLEYHETLRSHVAQLQETGAWYALSQVPRDVRPSAGLKHRIFATLDARGSRPAARAIEAIVVTDAFGRIEWFNSAFTAICGYELNELRGRKPSQILQGPATEPAAVERMRTAFRLRRPCQEVLTNYHKDGAPYQVDLRIAPVLDDAGEPLWFVARERLLSTS